ncbi:hypothetical protein D9M71_270260 [compost metagenome]
MGVASKLVLIAQLLFEHAREGVVVDGLASDRVFLQQRHEDHARLEVVADQATDDPGTSDVQAQLLDPPGRAVVSIGHHRPATEALFGHFGPAHRGCPQRLHPGTVHAWGDEQGIVDLLEHLEVLRVVDVAFAVLHHHPHGIAQTPQGLAVFQVVLDERLALRKHLLEAGVERQPGGREVTEQYGDHQATEHYQQAVVEDQAFEQVAGTGIETLQLLDHRHRIEFVVTHIVFCLFCFTRWAYSRGN